MKNENVDTSKFHDLFNKELLHSAVLENQVVYSMMEAAYHYDDVADDLSEDLFYFHETKLVYRAIKDLAVKGEKYDAVMVADWLKSRQLEKDAGGEAFLLKLISDARFIKDIRGHVDRLKQYLARRKTETILKDALKTIQFDHEIAFEDALEAITDKLGQVTDSGAKAEEFADTKQAAFATMEQLQSLHFHGTPTGFIELDNHIGGIGAGQLVVIAGASSSGKSMLASNIAVNIMDATKKACLFYSMEMPVEQVTLRIICSLSNVPISAMKSNEWTDAQFARYEHSTSIWAQKPFYIDARGQQTIESIKTKTRRMNRELGGLGCVVVDYIQLMHSDSKTSMRSQEVDKITRGLKSLALELNIPVIALSQFRKTTTRPTVSDLRESGSIEQDADTILMIHHHDDGGTEVVVGKQRQGARNVGAALFFNGALGRFENPRGQPTQQDES